VALFYQHRSKPGSHGSVGEPHEGQSFAHYHTDENKRGGESIHELWSNFMPTLLIACLVEFCPRTVCTFLVRRLGPDQLPCRGLIQERNVRAWDLLIGPYIVVTFVGMIVDVLNLICTVFIGLDTVLVWSCVVTRLRLKRRNRGVSVGVWNIGVCKVLQRAMHLGVLSRMVWQSDGGSTEPSIYIWRKTIHEHSVVWRGWDNLQLESHAIFSKYCLYIHPQKTRPVSQSLSLESFCFLLTSASMDLCIRFQSRWIEG
jgi:hypothetical protein